MSEEEDSFSSRLVHLKYVFAASSSASHLSNMKKRLESVGLGEATCLSED